MSSLDEAFAFLQLQYETVFTFRAVIPELCPTFSTGICLNTKASIFPSLEWLVDLYSTVGTFHV